MCSGQHRIYFVEIVLLRVLTPARKNPCSKASPFKLGLPLFVCIRFQDLFHSPPGVLFAFPSRYWFTIGRSRVFSLGGWSHGPPVFRQDFTCPALLIANLVPPPGFRVRGYHPLWPDFPDRSANKMAKDCWLFRFRSPLLSESRLISVPCPTEMFQFRQFAPLSLWIRPRVTLAGRVSPFGNPRIKACLPAPRGLSQATTSFVACDRQGIHHMHLFA